MDYKDIEEVIGLSDWSKTEKIDELLKIDCYMYTNLGIDSTKEERAVVREKSKHIYQAIYSIDNDLGKELIAQMDN